MLWRDTRHLKRSQCFTSIWRRLTQCRLAADALQRKHEHDLLIEEQRRSDREPRMREQRIQRANATYVAELSTDLHKSLSLQQKVGLLGIMHALGDASEGRQRIAKCRFRCSQHTGLRCALGKLLLHHVARLLMLLRGTRRGVCMRLDGAKVDAALTSGRN